jgi:hypothetical protein
VATDDVYVAGYMSSNVSVYSGASLASGNNQPLGVYPMPGCNIHDVVVDQPADGIYASCYNLGYVGYFSWSGLGSQELTAPAVAGLDVAPSGGLFCALNRSDSVAADCNWGPTDINVGADPQLRCL